MSDETFPVIPERRRDIPSRPHPLRIPWSVAELAYSVYSGRYGSGQSLERLAERGGFHASEMDEYVPDWRERASDLTSIRLALGPHHNPTLSLAENVGRVVGEITDWRENAECIIANSPHGIRCRESNGPEDLCKSLVLTVARIEANTDGR